MEVFRSFLHNVHQKRHHVKLIFFLSLALLSSSALYLYYVNYATTQQLLIRQTIGQQILLERAGKQVVGQFFAVAERELYALSTSPNIQEQEPGWTQHRLDELMQTVVDKKSPLYSLYFLNAQGVVTAVSSQDGVKTTLGQSFADREYFTQTKLPANKGKIYISQPFISRGRATVGQTIIMVTIPVYNSAGRYQGALGGLILLDKFVNTFIQPLAQNKSEFWLLNHNGVLLAGGGGDEKNATNIFNYAKSNNWSGSADFAAKLNKALNSQESYFSWQYKRPGGSVEELYGSSIEIDVQNQKFWLIILNPKSQIITPLTSPWGMNLVPYVAAIATIFIGVIYLTMIRFAHQDGYVEGYTAAKEQYARKDSN